MSTLYCYDPEIGENTEYASGFFPFGIHAYSEEIAPVFSYLCCNVDEAEKVKLSTIAKWNEESRELRVPGIRLSTEEEDGGIWKVSVKIGGASASVEEEAVAEDIGNFAMLTDGGIYYRADLDEDMMNGELFFDGSRVDSDVMLDSIKGVQSPQTKENFICFAGNFYYSCRGCCHFFLR